MFVVFFVLVAVGMSTLTPDERSYARYANLVLKLGPCKIATQIGRLRSKGAEAPSHSTITRLLAKPKNWKPKKPTGRARRTTKAEDRKLVQILTKLQRSAKATFEVTAAMCLARWKTQADREHNADPSKPKVSTGIVSARLREVGRGWKLSKKKLHLDPEDLRARKAWAVKHKVHRAAHWHRGFIIDNKQWTCRTSVAGRLYSLSTRVRGAYREVGKGHLPEFTVPSKLKHRAGSNLSINILAGVCNGKIAMWHKVHGSWNSQKYANIVRGPLSRRYCQRSARFLLRDNDPKGYKTQKGKAAEAEKKLQVRALPCRSPDLNPLDYSLWHEINRRMLNTEASWPTTKRETAQQWEARLKRTALSLPSEVVKKAVGAMPARLRSVIGRKGGWVKGD